VSLLAVGDIMFSRNVARVVEKNGADCFFSKVDGIFRQSDITIGNLENPISNKGVPNPENISNFRASPKVACALKRFTILTLANNHIFDFGSPAIEETIKVLNQQGVIAMGVGKKAEEARRSVIITRKGVRFGFLNYTSMCAKTNHCRGYTLASLKPLSNAKRDISNLKRYVNFIIVSLHFGYAGVMYPSPEAIDQARALIDSGANLIIGHHPHILQGVERYRHGFILYSLGDFIFDGEDLLRKETGIYKINFTRERLVSIELLPLIIDNSYKPVPAGNSKAFEIYIRIKKLSQLLNVSKNDKLFLEQAKKTFINDEFEDLRLLFRKNGIKGIITKLKRLRNLRLLHLKILLEVVKSKV